MNDAYAEWLVKRKNPAYNYVLKGLLVFVSILALLFAMVNPFGILVLVAVGAGVYFIFPTLSLEFEYLVVNDQITIDKIMGQSRRKKAWEGTMESVQIVAPVEAYQFKDLERQGMKTLDFTSHMEQAKVYGIIYQSSGELIKILFEPNDKILQCMRQKAPRKVIL